MSFIGSFKCDSLEGWTLRVSYTVHAYVVEDDIMEKLLRFERDKIVEVFNQMGQVNEPSSDNIKLYWFVDGEYQNLPQEINSALKSSPNNEEIFTPEDETHFHLQPIRAPLLPPRTQGQVFRG